MQFHVEKERRFTVFTGVFEAHAENSIGKKDRKIHQQSGVQHSLDLFRHWMFVFLAEFGKKPKCGSESKYACKLNQMLVDWVNQVSSSEGKGQFLFAHSR